MTWPATATLIDVLLLQCARHPEKPAFRFLDRGEREADCMTYAQLDRRARIIGQALRDSGAAGGRIVLAYPPCLEVIAALFGCLYAGATVSLAPIARHGNGFERIRIILEDADPACILCLQTMPPEATGDADGPPLKSNRPIPCIFTDTLSREPEDFTPPATAPTNLAVLQYTSGSTGRPRAVMLTHANLMHNQAVLQSVLRSGPDDIAVSWLPLYHDMGLIGAVFQSIYVGGTCVLMAPLSFLQRPLRWLQAISTYRATISMAPAFAYELCTRFAHRKEATELDLSCWTGAICGGETIRARALETFADRFQASGFDRRALLPAYGLAEATLLATSVARGDGLKTYPAHEAAGQMDGRLVCCGQTWCNQNLAIVDPDSRLPCQPGVRGEIWLRGGSVAAGYWKRPLDTEDIFNAHLAHEQNAPPWLRTGDLGYLGADGLVVTGRRKDVIILHGVNIDPMDLENAAADCDPCLVASTAVALEHEDGTRLVLIQEVARSALNLLDAHAITGKVIAVLSRDFGVTLHDLVLVRPNALPRTTSGKIQRYLCRENYLAGDLARLPAIDHPGLGRCRPQRAETP